MSFTIEFNNAGGHTDVVQMTGSSSMNNTFISGTVREPASGDYSIGPYKWYIEGGGVRIFFNSVQIFQNYNPSNTTQIVFGDSTYYRGQYMGLDGIGDIPLYRYYRVRNVISNTPVTITGSTDQNGAPHIGGLSTVTAGETIQDGESITSGINSEFGVIVKEGGSEIMKASHYSPAIAGEGSIANVSESIILTASQTSLTVESFGLKSDQILEQEDTNIIVEEV